MSADRGRTPSGRHTGSAVLPYLIAFVAAVARQRTKQSSTDERVIARILAAAQPRPISTSSKEEKNKYAVQFADAMGTAIAQALSTHLPGTECSPKRKAKSVGGAKQLDVNFSPPEMGLALGVSLKSVHIREATGGRRYTHNMKRNEEELRIEASGYHKRQPYAVMVGVLFLPFDCCDDGKKDNSSSFGSWVRHLRPYAGRSDPHDDADRFEKIFIGLYEPDGSNLRFFDVDSDPPKNGRPRESGALAGTDGRPRRTLTFDEFISACHHEYLRRNSLEFKWDDGTELPLDEGTEDDEDEN